ncbi:hypothetical protein L1049_009989 [Liquidambar formosana]|uniref:DUF2921 domain-containing protein n=1 Tax=Liquidambar formosana TaxID=63359 RepID=A0AAP0N8Z9_LIQFO
MESDSSPPLHRSRVRVFPINPLQIHQLPSIHTLIFLFFFIANISTTTSISKHSQALYAKHCNHMVPASTPTEVYAANGQSFQLTNGYFTGGDRILGQNPQSASNSPMSFSFYPRFIYNTDADGVIKLEGSLSFQKVYTFLGDRRSNQFRQIRRD